MNISSKQPDTHYSEIYHEFYDGFRSITNTGKQYAKQQNIAIVGLARNIEKYLIKNLAEIDDLSGLFKSCKYFIYENDSIDNTKNILQTWSFTGSNKTIDSEQLNAEYLPNSTSNKRTNTLAYGRNKCLNFVKKHQDIDYVIVIDLDFSSIFRDGLLNSFGWLSLVNYASAIAGFSFILKKEIVEDIEYTLIDNYDSWAYRHNWWSDTFSVDSYNNMSWFNQWIPIVGSPIFAVNSAFGGCCIYRRDFYIQGLYEGYDCEHVTFHKNILSNNKNFKLFVNPSQIMYL